MFFVTDRDNKDRADFIVEVFGERFNADDFVAESGESYAVEEFDSEADARGGWDFIGRKRVANTAELSAHAEVILDECEENEAGWQWLAESPVTLILSWVRDRKNGLA